MLIVNRPPHDKFTFQLFCQLTNSTNLPASSIYLWSPVIDPSYSGYWEHTPYWEGEHWYPKRWHEEDENKYKSLMLDYIRHDTIVLGVKDHLTSYNFNPWTEEIPVMVKYLKDFTEFYSDKKIILLTSLENLDKYIQRDNVRVICWGGDLTNQIDEYQQLAPVLDKNFDSNKNYVSLNRNPRSHRAMLVSLLHGLDLQSHGLISCMFKDTLVDLFDETKWQFDDEHASIKNTIATGFELLKQSTELLSDDYEIYTTTNDNVTNFKNTLSKYYTDTFVEIITETSYTEKAYLLTEKTLNSIYGCNFPILLSSSGAVALLRDAGMDMFDDIIDHSYDLIDNPVDRLNAAIYNNKRLLSDNAYVKQIWQENQHRFIKNVEFAKSTIYDFYRNRATDQFLKAINDV
jgi:hypothetical protein